MHAVGIMYLTVECVLLLHLHINGKEQNKMDQSRIISEFMYAIPLAGSRAHTQYFPMDAARAMHKLQQLSGKRFTSTALLFGFVCQAAQYKLTKRVKFVTQ